MGLYNEYKGNIEDYLGFNIEEQNNGKIWLTQPQIIDSIISDINLSRNTAPQQTSSLSTKIIRRDVVAPMFDAHLNYGPFFGKLKFLEKITRPDIAYAIHQRAHFSQDP